MGELLNTNVCVLYVLVYLEKLDKVAFELTCLCGLYLKGRKVRMSLLID